MSHVPQICRWVGNFQPFWFWRALKLKPWCCTIGGFSHGQLPKRLPLASIIRHVWCQIFTGTSTRWTRSFTELRLLATADDLGRVSRWWFCPLITVLWRIRCKWNVCVCAYLKRGLVEINGALSQVTSGCWIMAHAKKSGMSYQGCQWQLITQIRGGDVQTTEKNMFSKLSSNSLLLILKCQYDTKWIVATGPHLMLMKSGELTAKSKGKSSTHAFASRWKREQYILGWNKMGEHWQEGKVGWWDWSEVVLYSWTAPSCNLSTKVFKPRVFRFFPKLWLQETAQKKNKSQIHV